METADHGVAKPLPKRRDFIAHAVSRVASGLAAAAAIGPGAGTATAASRDPFIDTHVHFYDPMRPEGVPWPGKGDPVLYRRVLPDEWERLVAARGVVGAIVVEASPWVEDNQWLLDLAARHAATRPPETLGIVGVVGNLPLGQGGGRQLVDRFAKHRLFRGIRVNGDKLLSGLEQQAFREDLVRLADHGLSLDLNGGRVFDAAVRVAEKIPALRVVVDHMGNTRMTAEGPLPEWRAAIETAARRPNVYMKVSALAETAVHSLQQPKAPLDTAFYERWLVAAWNAFGAERLMFGSNWPVSDRAAGYGDVVTIVAPFVRDRGPDAERWFWHAASQAAYRWR